MDGTIADLYGYDKWLEYLENENEKPFTECKPLVNTQKLNDLISKAQNTIIGIITWLPKDASAIYSQKVATAKMQWLNKYLPAIKKENVHILPYGTPKAKANIKRTKQIYLIDDNKEVREDWTTQKQRKAINEKELEKFMQGMCEV